MLSIRNLLVTIVLLNSFVTAYGISSNDQKIIEEAERAYKTIYDHYSDLLEIYYSIDKSKSGDRFYHCANLVEKVKEHVKGERLPLYGNFFNRIWKNMYGVSNQKMPLTKFVTVLSEDAIGHLNKYRNKVIEINGNLLKINDLLASLKNMQEIVKKSSEYSTEELFSKIDQLEAENNKLKADLQRERDRNIILEREAYNNKRHIY